MVEEEKVRKFVFVADGEVFFMIGIPDNGTNDGIFAGMHSNPKIVEVADISNIHAGSKYIDGEFYTKVNYGESVLMEDDYEVED